MLNIRSHFKHTINELSQHAQLLFIKASTLVQWYAGPTALLEAGLDPQATLTSAPKALMSSVQHALMQNGRYTPPKSLIEWAKYSVQYGGGHKFWSVLPHLALEFHDQKALIGSAMVFHNTDLLTKLLPYVSFYGKSPFDSLGVTAQFIALTKKVIPEWTPFLTPSMGAITLRTWFPSMPPSLHLHPNETQLRLLTRLDEQCRNERVAWLALRTQSGISNTAESIMCELLYSSNNMNMGEHDWHTQILPLHLSQANYEGFQKQFPHFGWPFALALYAQRSPSLSETTISFMPSNPMEQQVCVDSIHFLRWAYPTSKIVVPALWKSFIDEKPSNVLTVMMALDEPRLPDINNLVFQYFDRMQNSLTPSINEAYAIPVPVLPTVY